MIAAQKIAQKVLIVEDEMIVQLHLRVIVQELGYIVTGVAATADEALTSAAENMPDLVLMDIQLPGGQDGIETARGLRARYDLPVVFVTAYADEETVGRSLEVRALGYVVKPFNLPQIRAALSTAFAKQRELLNSRESEHSLESVLGSMGDAVVVTDMQKSITFVNARAAALTGWSRDEARQRHLLEVFKVAGDTDASAFEKLTAQALLQDRASSIPQLELVTRDGATRLIEGEFRPLNDANDSRIGLIVVFKEIPRPRKLPAAATIYTASRRFGEGTKMAIYSHDTFGLGHLQRCLNISRSLVARFPGLSILLVTGSPAVHRYSLLRGIDYVKLPAVRKVAPEKYEARSLGLSYKGMLRLRTNLMLQSIQSYDPHVLLVDHAPVGMRGEILPSLEWLHDYRPKCIKILGMRDVLDDPDAVMELWKSKGIDEVLRKHYDHILIYGSPLVYDPVTAYRFTEDLKAKTHFCHYIREISSGCGETKVENAVTGEKPLVVVTIGGGDGAGEQVIGSYLEMLQRFRSDIAFESLILTGPFLGAKLLRRFRNEIEGLPARLVEFVSSTSPYMKRADLIVSTGGYNTMIQTLTFGKKALVIPRVMHRKEQLIRARRFEEMGLVTCLHPDDVTPEHLYATITRELADPSQPIAEARADSLIPLDGPERFADFCSQLQVTGSFAEGTADPLVQMYDFSDKQIP